MKRNPLYHLKDVLRKKGIERLTGHYKVNVKTHPKYPNLHMFKYNQFESPMSNAVVQQCRGIILDKDDDWKTVCHGLNKFFNLEEGCAAEIDWNTAKVYEKADGSCAQLFWYDNQWHMTTLGSPDASGDVGFNDFTFNKLFWQTWNNLGYTLPEDKSLTYVFELMTPYNQIVVQHKDSKILLLAVRNLIYGYEVDSNYIAQVNNWQTVKQFDFGYTDEIKAALERMNGSEQEGFIVVDGSFNRVKMKCEDYVRKHRLVSSLSPRNLLDIVRTGEQEEVLTYLPYLKDDIKALEKKLNTYIEEVEIAYGKIKNIKEQKAFANAATKTAFSSFMFNVRSGKSKSIKDSILNHPAKKLEKII